MKHHISKDRTKLTITVDEAERQELREPLELCGGNIHCDVSMHDFLEPLICNSELEWINPADTCDLTDAPMLGVTAEQDRKNYTDDQDRKSYTPRIVERWAFMDYAIRSPLEDLRDKGEAVFVGGDL